MSHARRAVALSVAALCVVASAAPLAPAQDEEPPMPSDYELSPRCLEFRSAPRLALDARRADTVALDFELTRRPRRVTRVSVAGRTAQIHRRDGRRYRAVLRRTGSDNRPLLLGRRYRVRIDVELAPSPELCLLSVPHGKDHTPPGGRTCAEGCFDAYVNRLRLNAKPR